MEVFCGCNAGKFIAALESPVMPTPPRVALACRRPRERAAIAEWLRSAGFEPVVLGDGSFASGSGGGRLPVAVVADVGLLTPAFIASARDGDLRRPILAIGDPGDPNEARLARRHIRLHARPLDQQVLILAASLAHAENQLVRRSERREVPRVPISIEGVPAVLLDVSNEGLRLEIDVTGGAKLLPEFVVDVPLLKMAVPVKRVWVRSAPAGSRRVQCGGSLLAFDERTRRVWQRLAHPGTRIAPPPPEPMSDIGLLDRVTTMLEHTSLPLPWRKRP